MTTQTQEQTQRKIIFSNESSYTTISECPKVGDVYSIKGKLELITSVEPDERKRLRWHMETLFRENSTNRIYQKKYEMINGLVKLEL